MSMYRLIEAVQCITAVLYSISMHIYFTTTHIDLEKLTSLHALKFPLLMPAKKKLFLKFKFILNMIEVKLIFREHCLCAVITVFYHKVALYV